MSLSVSSSVSCCCLFKASFPKAQFEVLLSELTKQGVDVGAIRFLMKFAVGPHGQQRTSCLSLSIYLSIYISVYLSVCLSLCLCLSLFVCLSLFLSLPLSLSVSLSPACLQLCVFSPLSCCKDRG